MAAYYFEKREMTAVVLPGGGGHLLSIDVLAAASARSITLNVGDTVYLGPFDLEKEFPGPVEELVFLKRTNTSNADTTRIQGALTEAELLAGTLFCTVPQLKAPGTGSNPAYSIAAANHTVVRGAPVPVFRPEIQIVTSVPANFQLFLWILFRNV